MTQTIKGKKCGKATTAGRASVEYEDLGERASKSLEISPALQVPDLPELSTRERDPQGVDRSPTSAALSSLDTTDSMALRLAPTENVPDRDFVSDTVPVASAILKADVRPKVLPAAAALALAFRFSRRSIVILLATVTILSIVIISTLVVTLLRHEGEPITVTSAPRMEILYCERPNELRGCGPLDHFYDETTGTIPSELGHLTGLDSLNHTGYKMTGAIPSEGLSLVT